MAALKILVNFTSSHLCEVMQQQLGLSGMCITIMPHGADVRAAVEETNPDIVLIDWPSGGTRQSTSAGLFANSGRTMICRLLS